MKIKFEDLEMGQIFYDPNTQEKFEKVCGNSADWLNGLGKSAKLCTFDADELVYLILE